MYTTTPTDCGHIDVKQFIKSSVTVILLCYIVTYI